MKTPYSRTTGRVYRHLPKTDLGRSKQASKKSIEMDYSIVAVGLGIGIYLVYYCCGRQLLSMYADSEGDYERDGDQTTRIRHGNL
jgi:hypothetical protein